MEKSAAQNCREHSSPCVSSRVLTRASMRENYLKLERERPMGEKHWVLTCGHEECLVPSVRVGNPNS